ncbi:hypothetical protein [Pinibacter soli]|uniref:Lipocalin-like domain-containing protein n=1 Tax=Pinibacter soli TaxID=3044211 RepID=A0ABT6R9M5_9BACT|nr:hypothetical protein [Pinibacter soli]MDI3319272.1 hypothetical protein [Pinibacter soli]
MKQLVLLVFILTSCTTVKQPPSKMIVGSWAYLTAERLGDGSQNDPASIAEFDKRMLGKIFIFNSDGTCKTIVKQDTTEVVIQEGKYTIAQDGQSMQIFNNETIKTSLTDSIFKFYSQNNGAFVWRKIKP